MLALMLMSGAHSHGNPLALCSELTEIPNCRYGCNFLLID
jgi:hypothetical protein